MCKKYHFIQNICERRLLEERLLSIYFEMNNVTLGKMEESDYILFFSCGMKEIDSNEKIEQIIKKKPLGKVIVFGCFPAMCQHKYPDKILYLSLQDISHLDILINAEIKINEVRNQIYKKIGSTLFKDAMKKWDPRLSIPKCYDVFPLIISTGCSQKCSYCTIRNATGNLKSRSINEIITMIEVGLSKGYHTFRFQCENLGTYGDDIGLTLGDLLNEMSKIKRPFSIDLPDLHPKGFIHCFREILQFIDKKNVYLVHIPLQSGNQRILDLMNRETDLKEFLKYFKEFKKRYPSLKVGTDIIAGFPTETHEEYMDSHRFLEQNAFNWIYLHGYNIKPNALANDIYPKIDGEVIANRIRYTYERVENIACYLNNYRQG